MKKQDQQETLKLVETLLEGEISQADVTRLESLVLQDPNCLMLYLEMMQLHGNLHWDAAGCGAELPAVDAPRHIDPDQVPNTRTKRIPARTLRGMKAFQNRFSRGLASLVAVLAIGVFSVWMIPPASNLHHLVLEDADLSTEGTDAKLLPNEDPLGHDSELITGVQLPRTPVATSPTSSDSLMQGTSTDQEPLPFDITSDTEIVSFINNTIRSRWEEGAISPSPKADESAWVRRVHLDIAGRIPTSFEVESFLKNSDSAKHQKLLDSLLKSRDYSSHFASMWTTLLVGRSWDRQINREALFAYLQRQFGNNDPWSETVTDLISAEGPANESGPANFLLAHLNNEAVPATAITARIFLCQQLQCSQCHRHPTAAEWGQETFWEFNAFFQRTSIEERLVVDQETGESQRVLSLVEGQHAEREPAYYEDLQGVMKVAYPKYSGVDVQPQDNLTMREQLAQLMTTGNDLQLAKAFVNRKWMHFFGFAFTRSVDDMGPHLNASHPELLDGIARAFVAAEYDVKRLIRWICLSDAYHLSSDFIAGNAVDEPESGEIPYFSRMYLKPLSPEQLFNSLMIAAGASPEDLHRRNTAYVQREEWLQQFFTAIDNEENSELSTFDGSLPQTLMMMNGDLVQRAVDPVQGQILKQIVSDHSKTETDRIRELCLAALSRYPSRQELEGIRKLLRTQIRQQTSQNIAPQVAYNEALRDVYWAYLNSSEFSVNR